MADIVKQILAKPIQLADQVTQADDVATSFKQECAELKSKTERLVVLLRQAARASNDLYQRPTRRIIDDTEQALEMAMSIVTKCCAQGLMQRVFTIIPSASFRNLSSQLENSIVNVSWLLRVSATESGDEYLGLPPIAANEPILCFIWEHIAILYTGSVNDRSEAAASLTSLAKDNHRNGKLIVEEGGVGPLLKLLKEGKLEGQENAAKAIGLLGRDTESVEHMVHLGVCSVFVKILKEGSMKVQAVVAWAVSELSANYPKCQDLFHQHNIIRLLVSHLAFETVQEHSKYAIASKATSIHAVVFASNNNNRGSVTSVHKVNDNNDDVNHHHQHSVSTTGVSSKGRELEESVTKDYMKAMAARALWKLAKGNSSICRSITESRALLCFAVLLENGTEDIQYNSAMAVKEITAVAEQDSDLRKSAFKPNSPACKALVDQLVRIIEKEDLNLLIPCIRAIGNLARTFRVTETTMISPLVKLLDEREAEISNEAAIALAKFACNDNYLHMDHCKAIVSMGGAKHLIQLVFLGEKIVQSSALLLLCYIALHVPALLRSRHT
ncbi:importin subunit alpha-1a-like [Nicotiana sylvestris]|uniref:importin subunit alpha-1a-like n=1 Tax=Nicotiana sylvestris TaxID=4096 RepID=UPI00388C8905